MANRDNNIRLCFSIPELEANTHTHYFHIYELLEEVGKQIKIFVVVDMPTKGRHTLKNVESIYFTRFSFFPFRKAEQFFIFCYARFKGYKYFYTHYSLWNALLTSLITKLFGGKTYIWSCHVYRRIKLNEIDSLKKLRQWFTGILQIFTFKSVDYIVTGTQSVASEYIKEFNASKDKFTIIPNWVNPDRFHSKNFGLKKWDGRNKVIAFIHSLTVEKGSLHLPTIMKQVVERMNEVNFTIIGDGVYREFIEKAIQRDGLRDKVQLFGYVPNNKIPKYLAFADLLILPSENEGFPSILIEAMAMGVPFVATDVGGIPDIVTDLQREFIVRRGDIGEFSRKVIDLLSDKDKQRLLREESLKHAANFSLQKVSRVFLEKIK